MNTKVREYVRLEMSRLPEVNKNKIDMSDFDTIFFLFEKILNMDTGNRGLDGLRGQLSESIKRIICTKIDRSDIDTLFPNVWGNYEPYIKKIIYIFDKRKYNELKQNRATFDSYLDYLDIESFEPDEGKRTPESECFFRAKQLRNNDSHECPVMSVMECYENLIYSKAAMYLATKKAYLKFVINSKQKINQIDITPITPQVIKRDTLPNIGFFEGEDIFKLSDYCQNLKELYIKGVHYRRHFSFDKNGRLIRSSTSVENNMIKYNYKYITKGNTVEKISHCRETDKEYVDAIYIYNAFDELIQVQNYILRKEENVYYSTTFIDYLTDGGVVIREERKNSPYCSKLQFNNKGLLVHKSIPTFSPSTYIYSETGELSKINREDGTQIEVDQIKDSILFSSIKKDGERVKEQSWTLEDGKIQSIAHYESDELTKMMIFKYYL